MRSISRGAVWLLAGLTLAAGLPAVQAATLVRTSFEVGDEPLDEEGHPLPEAKFPVLWSGQALSPDGAGEALWEATTARTGQRSIGVSNASGTFAAVGPRGPVQPGDWIKVRVWARTWQADGGAAAWLIWLDPLGRPIGSERSTPTISEETWSFVTLEASVPPGVVAVQPALVVLGPGVAWFDDIEVRSRPTALLALQSLTIGRPQAGERCSLRVSVEGDGVLPSTDSVEIEIGAVTGRRVAARGSFPARLPRLATKGVPIDLGPFDLAVDPYAPPGRYCVWLRVGDMVLNSLALPNGTFEVAGRPRYPSEGPSATVSILAPPEASAGASVTAQLGAVIAPAADGPVIASAWLRRGRETYAATETLLAREPGPEQTTRATGSIEIAIPDGAPAGDYRIEAFLVGRYRGSPSAQADVRVTGAGRPVRLAACGRYLSSDGTSHAWRTTPTGTLVWDGMPYVPLGVSFAPSFLTDLDPADGAGNQARWDDFLELTRQLAEMDLKDVYLRTAPRGITGLPVEAVQRVVDRLERLGFRYGLEIGGEWPEEYTGYRIGRTDRIAEMAAGTDAGLVLDDRLLTPDAWALVAVYSAPPGPAPIRMMRVPVRNGSLAIRIPADAGAATYCGYATAEVTVPPGEGPGDVADDVRFRIRKAEVGRALEALRFGRGLRFLTNPLSSQVGLPPADVLPSFPSTFGERFAGWLEDHYAGDLGRLRRAWCFAPESAELPSFSVAGRLVPVGGPGPLRVLADPQAEHWYLAALDQSSFASDLEAFREEMQAESTADIIAAAKSIVDVPVLLAPRPTVRAVRDEEDEVGEGAPPPGFLISSLTTGKHLVCRDASDGPDGVMLWQSDVSDLMRPVVPTRLGENRLSLRQPWLVGLAGAGCGGPSDAARSLGGWGAKAAFLERLSWPCAPPGQSGLPVWSTAEREALRQLLLESSPPVLVSAYPRRLRRVLGVAPPGALPLDGDPGEGAAREIAEGVWLVPAATLPPEGVGVYAVTCPNAARDTVAAGEIERFAGAPSERGLILLGGREDLGAIPSLDSLLLPTPVTCPFGAGEANGLREGSGVERVTEGGHGWPVLAHRDGLWLFPVHGLDLGSALWLLRGLYGGSAAAEPAPPAIGP